jgi:hypothetical protein
MSDFLDFYQLMELSQLRAINCAIEPSRDSLWREKCREYSVRFFTPLHIVINDLDPMFILQALYEEQFSRFIVEEELEEILEKLYTVRDPDYTSVSKEELEELVDNVLNKEIARKSKKKKPTQETIQNDIKENSKKSLLPKSGSMSFKDLNRIESSSESNKLGFKD